jgi:hypothetical protein
MSTYSIPFNNRIAELLFQLCYEALADEVENNEASSSEAIKTAMSLEKSLWSGRETGPNYLILKTALEVL